MENTQNFEQKKNNKVLIVLLVIFGLIIIGLGGYVVYDKFISNTDVEEKDKGNNNNNNNDDNNDNNNDTRPAVSKMNFYDECRDNASKLKVACDKYITLNNENLSVAIVGEYSISDSFAFVELKINDKSVYKVGRESEFNLPQNSLRGIESFQDLIIIEMSDGDGNGTYLQIIDKNGNKVQFIDNNLESNSNKTFCQYSYSIIGNKIVSKGSESACWSGMTCDTFCFTDTEYQAKANNIYGVEKEIEYLGNSKFSSIKKVKDLLFKDIYSKKDCDDMCTCPE